MRTLIGYTMQTIAKAWIILANAAVIRPFPKTITS